MNIGRKSQIPVIIYSFRKVMCLVIPLRFLPFWIGNIGRSCNVSLLGCTRDNDLEERSAKSDGVLRAKGTGLFRFRSKLYSRRPPNVFSHHFREMEAVQDGGGLRSELRYSGCRCKIRWTLVFKSKILSLLRNQVADNAQ